jgi:DNA-binding transcriptional ArsR family regulator
MTTMHLAPSDRRVLEALAGAGGEASPAELREATGLAARTVTKALSLLRGSALVEGSQARPRLSLTGREASSSVRLPRPAGSWDGVLADLLPPWHAAALRLVADMVAARCLGPRSVALPGLVVYGPPVTFKSTIAALVCEMFGLDPVLSIVPNAAGLSPGAVIGRRIQGPEGWRFEPSSYTRQPFVCFDELTDAADPVIGEVTRLLYGEREVLVEGERVELVPATMVCFNPPERSKPLPVLTEGTWRRVLRFCTGTVVPSLPGNLAQRLSARVEQGWPDPIDVQGLRWPALHVAAELAELWNGGEGRGGAAGVLTDRGRAWHDWRAIELLVLARAARTGAKEGEMLPAAVGTIADVLALAETVPGLVAQSGWRFDVDQLASIASGQAGVEDTVRALAARQTAADRLARSRATSKLEAQQVSLELVGARSALQEAFRQMALGIQRVPSPDRPVAKGLRAQLRHLAEMAGQARNAERLTEIGQLGAPVVDQARQLAARVLNEHNRAVRDEQQRRAQEAHDRRGAQAQARWVRQMAEERARQLREQRKELDREIAELRRLERRKTTRNGEDVLGRLVATGCVVKEQWHEIENRRSIGDILSGRPGKQVDVLHTAWRDVAGRRHLRGDLARWETVEVRKVIAARIAELDGSASPAPQGTIAIGAGYPAHFFQQQALPPGSW